MKFIAAIIFLLFLDAPLLQAQHFTKEELKELRAGEDSMKYHSFNIITGRNASDRFRADSIFTRMLVRSLKINHSFSYPFDSLFTISKLYAPDSSFRIITWQMLINENVVRQHGAIQMKMPDGSLKLLPLIDKSDVTVNVEDSVGNNYGWMGAVYYKIIQTQYNGKNYYTLLGFDENNIRSDKKVIEVLRFENNEPIFGGRYFNVPNDKLIAKNPARYIMEFKKEAGPRLTYDSDLKMIIMEHLISESNQPAKKYTLVGDGDYEGFKWAEGKWIYVNKVFNEVTPDGKAPVPEPLSEDKRMDASKYVPVPPNSTKSPD